MENVCESLEIVGQLHKERGWSQLTTFCFFFQHCLQKLLLQGTTQCSILTSLYIVVEKIVRKGEIPSNKQFLLFPQCFLPYIELIFHF